MNTSEIIDVARVEGYVRWMGSKYVKPIHDWAYRKHWRYYYRSYDWKKQSVFERFRFWFLWKVKTACTPDHYAHDLSVLEKIAVGVKLGQYQTNRPFSYEDVRS